MKFNKKHKFNVIFALDNTLIMAKDGTEFPLNSKDSWMFKPNVLDLMLSIYTNGGNINIYGNQTSAAFGYILPVELEEILVTIYDNIITYIALVTNDKVNTIIKCVNIIPVVSYNSEIRKGKTHSPTTVQSLKDVLNVGRHNTVYIGSDSGINLEVATFTKLSNSQLVKLNKQVSIRGNIKRINDVTYTVKSSKNIDMYAALELGVDVYLDIDLFMIHYSYSRYNHFFHNMANDGEWLFDDACPNLVNGVIKSINYDKIKHVEDKGAKVTTNIIDSLKAVN